MKRTLERVTGWWQGGSRARGAGRHTVPAPRKGAHAAAGPSADPGGNPAALLHFACNVCGTANRRTRTAIDREVPSCDGCGSTGRMRSVVHALSTALFGKSLAIDEFPHRPDIVGRGMSDWPPYADRLTARLGYVNSFLHQEPVLDICAPPAELLGALDFLISTDVFEHVAPPVDIAFHNALRLLRPGGVLVFSVPYQLEGGTVEHFPELADYRLERIERIEGIEGAANSGAGSAPRWELHNRTADGREQVFRDLVFHGGPGETLEMRVFSLPDLEQHFAAAGFTDLTIFDRDVPERGIVIHQAWSLTMTARRPRAT